MNNGLERFTFFLGQVKELLDRSKTESNPAWWLFKNNARVPFFMLEALAKFYGTCHNIKKFEKLKVHFKMVEDGLGQIDYYNSLIINKQIDQQLTEQGRKYLKDKLDQQIALLNDILIEKEWLSADDKRIKKINKRLKKVVWLGPKEELKALSGFYKKSITNINEFVIETQFQFNDIETQVHELRRRLRWLSIYPQAFLGLIQFDPIVKNEGKLQKYLTQEIINSPFNVFPSKGNNKDLFLIKKNYFLALSWMIDQLGKLKDEGLLLTGLSEAMVQTIFCTESESLEKAQNLLGEQQKTMKEILNQAESISKKYFEEKNLECLF